MTYEKNAPTVLTPIAERVAASATLRGSEPLRNLLVFLAKRSDLGGSPPKENEIAGEVFHRPHFDPRVDSVVRVQAGRLRSKLAEFYMGEGASEDSVLEVPKGAYLLVVHSRSQSKVFTESAAITEAERAPANGDTANLPHAEPPNRWARTRAWVGIAAVTLAGVALAAWVFYPRQTAVQMFWSEMGVSGDPPLIVFSNPPLIGRSETGMHLIRPGEQGSWVNETYSGTGEVMAVFELTRLFVSGHHPLRIKRSQLLTWDEARSRDLIFLGAPEHNLPVGEVRLDGFHFGRQDNVAALINEKPRQGENSIFPGSVPPYTHDYAILSRGPGFGAGRHVVVLAGTTTYGTEAAAEFLSREDSVRELLRRLGSARDFTAVLRVDITGGAVVRSNLVLFR